MSQRRCFAVVADNVALMLSGGATARCRRQTWSVAIVMVSLMKAADVFRSVWNLDENIIELGCLDKTR